MSPDIKAVVAELERQNAKREFAYDTIKLGEALVDAWPSLLAELRRCWAIEEAAVRYREANEAIYNTEEAKRWDAEMEEVSKKLALFAALPPRKESK